MDEIFVLTPKPSVGRHRHVACCLWPRRHAAYLNIKKRVQEVTGVRPFAI